MDVSPALVGTASIAPRPRLRTRRPAREIGQLARAAGLMDPADPGRDALLVEQAGCLTWAGRPTGAEATCRALLVRDDDLAVTVRARIYLGRTLVAGGRARDAARAGGGHQLGRARQCRAGRRPGD